jgi:hypothetical protein
MSWAARLTDDRGHNDGEWGYTHNTNRMINDALDASGVDTADLPVAWFGHRCWWKLLGGMDGPSGAALLHRVITQLEADPDKYRAMNPPNGWGSYDGDGAHDPGILALLRQMRAAVPEWPTTWSVSG